jgi:Tol biopolymer transport system component/predicted Ser/Thr protein kinase
MSPDIPSLEDLVHAICEGTPVDWHALEKIGSETFRSQVAALRVVAGIAEVHRPPPATTTEIPDAPQRWGHLDVLEHIASGAFGDVYRAWDPQLDREVALKLLRRAPDADAHADEVVNEGRLLARLRHPHIVSVYGAARIDGQVGLWMEYLRGRTLAQAVSKEGALPARKVAEVGAALCDALAAVHKAGLVHRDVKAQNVMLADDGRVVLMDFGAGGDLRQAGLDIAGTPLYLAPEVARGAPASPQSDIYSLGVLLRYAATGAYSRDVVSPSKDKPLKRLLAVVTTASARDPDVRFTSADACGRALRDLLAPSRVSPTLVVVGTGLVVALGTLASGLLWRAPATRDRTGPAQQSAAPRLTLRPLWNRRPEGLDAYGKPSIDGRLLPMADEKGQLVIANIDLGGQRPPVDLKAAAADGLAACSDTSLVSLSPSGDEAAFSCEVTAGAYEFRVIRTDAAHPVQRRVVEGQWNPLEWSHPTLVLVESTAAPWQLALIDVISGKVQKVAELAAGVDGASLSPDAQWVAFDQVSAVASERHDVFVASARGGTPVPVAPGRHDDLLPSWTPDGSGVLFISDRTGSPGVWLQNVAAGGPAGPPQALAQDLGRVADVWAATRTGQLIYFRQTGLTRTMTVDVDSNGRLIGEPAQISTRQMGGTMMANWSPDSRRLAYQTTMTGSRSIALGVLDFASATERIVSVPFRWFGNPRWTHDGRRVAVRANDHTGREGVFLVDVESGEASPLKLSGPTEGEALQAFQMGHDNNIVTRVAKGFYRVDVPTGRERLLFPLDAGTGSFSISATDGSVAFMEWAEPLVALKVWSPDGTIRELLRLGATERFGDVRWTSDGRAILFTRFPIGQLTREQRWPSLWRIDVKTASAQPLGLRLDGLRDLSVSPDGRHISFTTGWPSREPWILENYLPTWRPADGTRR